MAKKQREEEWVNFIQVNYDVDEVRKINQGLPNAYIPFKVSWMEEFFQDMTPGEVGKVVLALYEFWKTGEKPKLESRELRFVLNPMASYLQTMLGSKFKTGCESGKKAALIREIRKLKDRGMPDSEIMEKYPEYQPPNVTSRHVTPRNNNQLSKSTAISNNQKSKSKGNSKNQRSTTITTATAEAEEVFSSSSSSREGVSDSEGDTSPSSKETKETKIEYRLKAVKLWGQVFGGFQEQEYGCLENRIEKFGGKATYETLCEILKEPTVRQREDVQAELYKRLRERQPKK